ncbi:dpy-30 domain-containing protein [Drepanopeziza brunnea f. sp. 'multigermtubi' MB_m1]|uniref:Dpy-30 domain-containing protein n=1 Tax=Marssonina brunnea f. sp. multigermtubi (strain MB_m1) TaxID=1072389 RepID=K1X6L6_MARBU|nr:dpy-30 domain-containing protein [Drepanopeziza brunnea f. sp. 'multigermtubi' MB_m1]EKD20731.1 dpy-30 domain-containing protein [Drepanopeziza brunnea f. sp. 'multigermtubi' MB_m1]
MSSSNPPEAVVPDLNSSTVSAAAGADANSVAMQQQEQQQSATPPPILPPQEQNLSSDIVMADAPEIPASAAIISNPANESPAVISNPANESPAVISNPANESPAVVSNPANAPSPIPARVGTPSRTTNGTDVASRAPSQHPEPSSTVPKEAPLHGAPVRQYMNSKVTGPVMDGMKVLAKEQPRDPLRVLGEYLLQRSKELEGT